MGVGKELITVVSVIIPVYNTKKEYLYRCIDSLNKQDYKDFEVLLVDDGSNADTYLQCDEIAKTNCNIKVLHKNNGGVSSARNFALQEVKGDFVTFIDSDDWVEPDFISTLITAIDDNNAGIAICGFSCEHISIDYPEGNIVFFDKKELFSNIISKDEIGGYLWNKMFRTKSIKQRFDESIHYCEDLEFVVNYICNIENGVFVNKKIYHYEKNEDSVTASGRYNSKVFSIIKAYEKIKSLYLINAPFKIPDIQKNLLNISFNLKKRYVLASSKNESEYREINNTIHRYFFKVFFQKNVTKRERIYLIAKFIGLK